MGKASRRKRDTVTGGGAIAVARDRPRPTGFEGLVEWWDVGLAGLALVFWLLGHAPGPVAAFAVPAWLVTGFAVGLLRPWLGLVLTIIVVPFLGGAVDQPQGEVLRVIPIYGAAARALFDRAIGRGAPSDPPWWVALAAVLAGLLYVGTFFTGFGTAPTVLPYITWLIGGPAAGMAAWIVASHVAARRHDELSDVVLVVTAVAVIVALVAYVGLPGIDLMTFPGQVEGGRLGALGYPTPTAMGLVVALPFAFAAAWRREPGLAGALAALVVAAVVLTQSRGPLIALGAGAVVAVWLQRRLDRRLILLGVGVGALALAGLVVTRYGADPSTALQRFIDQATGSDTDRVATWIAAVAITISSPIVGGGWRAMERYGNGQFLQHQVAYSHNMILHGFAEGGLPLGIANATVILYSAFMAWKNRHVHEAYLIAAVVIFLVCGLWDIPQVRSYASVMGGISLGLVAVRIVPAPKRA
jgi:hypothetical protein